MSTAAVPPRTGRRLALAPAEQMPPLVAALGLSIDPVPLWAQRLLTPPLLRWVQERWDSAARMFEFLPTDHLTLDKRNRSLLVGMEGLVPVVALEALTCMAADQANGLRATPWSVRALSRAAANGAAGSLLDLDDAAVTLIPGVVLRRWRLRLEISGADPESEWDRDEIRLPVLKPGAPNLTLRVREITQPWLRDLLVSVLRVRVHTLSDGSISKWALAISRLSRFLDTRSDRGRDPRMLSLTVMDQWASALNADSDTSTYTHNSMLVVVSAILSQARALGISDRVALPAGFAVHTGHYPQSCG